MLALPLGTTRWLSGFEFFHRWKECDFDEDEQGETQPPRRFPIRRTLEADVRYPFPYYRSDRSGSRAGVSDLVLKRFKDFHDVIGKGESGVAS
ncbi:hypothetical protein A5673_01290 [Mycobacterium sp. E3198]|nr:hypothetical protein A5673_01290 [Mycobacterium sp. E3198]